MRGTLHASFPTFFLERIWPGTLYDKWTYLTSFCTSEHRRSVFVKPVRKICEHFSAAVGCVVILGWVHLLLQHHPYIGIGGKYDGGI